MNCHATRAVLDLHMEQRLTPRREKAVMAHLASCAVCAPLATLAAPALEGVPEAGFKHRLAAAMKAARKTTEPAAPRLELALWPRDFSGVALAVAALVLIAMITGWSGAPSQRDMGDELAGRTP